MMTLTKLLTQLRHSYTKYLNQLPLPTHITGHIDYITKMGVEKLLKSTHFKASTIFDNTTPYLLKINMKYFLTIITDLVKACIKHSNFPLSLKNSIITPILKYNALDMTIMKHYRPISNLPFHSKLLERVISAHIKRNTYWNITLTIPDKVPTKTSQYRNPIT